MVYTCKCQHNKQCYRDYVIQKSAVGFAVCMLAFWHMRMDDVTLLAPTPTAMRLQLHIREDYAREISYCFQSHKVVYYVYHKRKARICEV